MIDPSLRSPKLFKISPNNRATFVFPVPVILTQIKTTRVVDLQQYTYQDSLKTLGAA